MSAASGPQGIRPPGGRPWMYGRGRGLRFTQNSSSVDMKRRNRSVEGLEEKEELKKLQEENNFLKEKLKKEKEDHERTKIKYEKTRNELEEKNTKLTRLGAKKVGKKSAFGAKKVASSTFKASAAAAEREEKEIKAVEKVESEESNISTEAASRLTYKQIERDQKKTTSQLEGKKLESASHLGMGLGGPRNVSHDTLSDTDSFDQEIFAEIQAESRRKIERLEAEIAKLESS